MAVFQSILTGTNQGLIWALLALGVYISFRVLDIADLTTEGSFTTGAAIVAILIKSNVDPLLATVIAFLSGGIAGLLTGLLHTKLKIPSILSGIITMTALYSINIRIMGTSNVPLGKSKTIMTILEGWLGIPAMYVHLLVGILVVAIGIGGLYWFFGTEKGAALRATGDNERMCRAQGINTDTTKIIGLMLGNGLIALSGALIAQQQKFSDVGMGIGAIVIGLASVIIGETIFIKAHSFWAKLIGIAVGSVVYRVIYTMVIVMDLMEASDLKLLTAVIVAAALAIPAVKNLLKKAKDRSLNKRNIPENVAALIVPKPKKDWFARLRRHKEGEDA